MMYDLILTRKFKKSLKFAKKRGLNIRLLRRNSKYTSKWRRT